MLIYAPMIITPRLMAGVQIGAEAWISLGAGSRNAEGRTHYGAWIDYPDGKGGRAEYEVTCLCSGCQGGDERTGLASLLCFLAAAVESRQYRERLGREYDPDDRDTNESLFPPAVVDWAAGHADEIAVLAMELEEGKRDK